VIGLWKADLPRPENEQTVTDAYAQKYNTKGSRKWVEGFAEPERQLTTLEFIPR
jgi:hypothetical protein